MNPRVLRRFVIYMFVFILVVTTGYMLLQGSFDRAPGDYYTEVGQMRLRDREYDKAMENFNRALKEMPNHRGALMGRALVYIQTGKYEQATKELTHLIDFLTRTVKPDDTTGRGALAAAYANRGIIYDRQGRYEQALNDYVAALKIDEGAVSGPDIFHKVLYGRQSTVRKRAEYLAEQLRLPPEKRLMRVPQIDRKQRMHRP